MAMQALEDAQITPADVHTVEVVGGSSRVPALLRIIKDFFGKEPGRTLNAKECVSRGAALNCAMLSPIFRSAMLSCLLPLMDVAVAFSHSKHGRPCFMFNSPQRVCAEFESSTSAWLY